MPARESDWSVPQDTSERGEIGDAFCLIERIRSYDGEDKGARLD